MNNYILSYCYCSRCKELPEMSHKLPCSHYICGKCFESQTEEEGECNICNESYKKTETKIKKGRAQKLQEIHRSKKRPLLKPVRHSIEGPKYFEEKMNGETQSIINKNKTICRRRKYNELCNKKEANGSSLNKDDPNYELDELLKKMERDFSTENFSENNYNQMLKKRMKFY